MGWNLVLLFASHESNEDSPSTGPGHQTLILTFPRVVARVLGCVSLKSTLMGQVLLQTGQVTQRTVQKYERQGECIVLVCIGTCPSFRLKEKR